MICSSLMLNFFSHSNFVSNYFFFHAISFDPCWVVQRPWVERFNKILCFFDQSHGAPDWASNAISWWCPFLVTSVDFWWPQILLQWRKMLTSREFFSRVSSIFFLNISQFCKISFDFSHIIAILNFKSNLFS